MATNSMTPPPGVSAAHWAQILAARGITPNMQTVRKAAPAKKAAPAPAKKAAPAPVKKAAAKPVSKPVAKAKPAGKPLPKNFSLANVKPGEGPNFQTFAGTGKVDRSVTDAVKKAAETGDWRRMVGGSGASMATADPLQGFTLVDKNDPNPFGPSGFTGADGADAAGAQMMQRISQQFDPANFDAVKIDGSRGKEGVFMQDFFDDKGAHTKKVVSSVDPKDDAAFLRNGLAAVLAATGLGMAFLPGGALAGGAGGAGGVAGGGALPGGGGTFGIVDTTVGAGGLGAGGAGGATSVLGAGAAPSSGTGLSFGGGNLGLTGSTGSAFTPSGAANFGLSGSGGIGMSASSPGAGLIGSGLGASEFASGAGSLLGSGVTNGGTTLGNAAASGVPSASGGAGTPPPANPNLPGAGGAGTINIPGIGPVKTGDLLGLGSTLLGGLSGAKGQKEGSTTSQDLPGFLQGPVAGNNGLIQRTQGLLADQMGPAKTAGNQMMTAGRGLLGRPIAGNGVSQFGDDVADNGFGQITGDVAGNGFGQIELERPDTASNPFLKAMADDIQRRTLEALAENNASIAGNFVGSGGLGGSRQGVAQGVAAGRAMDSLQGNLGNLFGQAFENESNRALQKFGIDTQFFGQQRGQDLQRLGLDMDFFQGQRGQDLQRLGLDQSFFGQQRGQDLMQAGLGADMLRGGLDTQFMPLKNASDVFSPFSGMGSTTQTTNSGGGWQGAAGGLLAGASMGRSMGWW